MTRRERTLALCVAGALGAFGLYKAGRLVLWAPLEAQRAGLDREQARAVRLQNRLREFERAEDDWQALTRRTLSTDPTDAQRRFREDIQELLEVHGLRNPKVTPGNFAKRKNEFVDVPLTITASGTLQEIVGFLTDFYRRDYLARLDKVTLAADQSVVGNINNPRRRPGGTRRGRTGGADAAAAAPAAESLPPEPLYGPEGPLLRVNITAVTLVLPVIKGVPHPVMEKIGPTADAGQLSYELAAYNQIVDHNLFKPWEAPRPVVTPPPAPPDVAVGPQPTPPPPPPPPANPRPNADKYKLVATTSLRGQRMACVLDETVLERVEVKRFRLDEPVDDGTLVLVHPSGIVVRAVEGGHPTDFFYRLGTTFAERQHLDPVEHADVYEALEAELPSTSAAAVVPPAGTH